MTPERREEIAEYLDSQGKWAMADDVRAVKRPGPNIQKRINGFTPHMVKLACLHLDIEAAGGEAAIDYFLDDPRVEGGSERERRDCLWKAWDSRNWTKLRKCIAAQRKLRTLLLSPHDSDSDDDFSDV